MRNSIIIREQDDIELMLEYAKKAGFQEVSIGLSEPEFFLRPDYKSDVAKIRELLDKNGLVCTQTHMPCYALLDSSEITKDETELAIRRSIEESARLGATWTAYHPRTDITNGYSRTKSFEANKAMLDGYLEDAEKYGVGLAVENMPLYPYSAAFWRFFGGGWEELCELCDTFQSDKIGICWDFGHANTAQLDQAAAIREIGERLKITHVHDNYKNGDHHILPAMGDCAWGCIDWQKPISALKEIGYEGALTLELIYPSLPMRESFVKLAYDSLDYIKSL